MGMGRRIQAGEVMTPERREFLRRMFGANDTVLVEALDAIEASEQRVPQQHELQRCNSTWTNDHQEVFECFRDVHADNIPHETSSHWQCWFDDATGAKPHVSATEKPPLAYAPPCHHIVFQDHDGAKRLEDLIMERDTAQKIADDAIAYALSVIKERDVALCQSRQLQLARGVEISKCAAMMKCMLRVAEELQGENDVPWAQRLSAELKFASAHAYEVEP